MKKKTTKSQTAPVEKDSVYFLKLILYVIVGSFWLKFDPAFHIGAVMINGIPFGLLVGLIFASHDHFAIDRKVEYGVLIVVAILTYFEPAGIVI